MNGENEDRVKISFTINGEDMEEEVDPERNLLNFIRENLGLTGTKFSCGTGDCGACTVLLDGSPIKSCQATVSSIEGKEVTTIEGVNGVEGEELHPIQKALIDSGAVQCGYCIPAIVLRTKWFLEKNPNPTRKEAREAVAPVLCRCTGYQKIVDGIMLAAERMGR